MLIQFLLVVIVAAILYSSGEAAARMMRRFGRRLARADAAARFLLYTVVGSTLMLVGILLLVTATGTADLDALTREGADLPHGQQVPREAPVPAPLEVLAFGADIARLNDRPLFWGSSTGESASAIGRRSSIRVPSCSQTYS